MKNYDIIVLGGGPGGYVAAIKGAQLGAKVLLIEAHKIGGVCLNYGCIPTKTLLRTANLYTDMTNASEFGIDIENIESVSINWKNLMKRKDKVVKQLTGGVKQLVKHNGIDYIEGFGTVIDKNTIEVDGTRYKGKNLILATGSTTRVPDIPGLRESFLEGHSVDSTGAIALSKRPESLTILGGGVIAVEFATLYNGLGTQVTLLQRSDKVLKFLDKDVQETMQKHLIKEGVKIITGVDIQSIDENRVHYEVDGEKTVIESDHVLVSLGRQPNLKGLSNLDLKLSPKGVEVDEHMETSVKGVYAIGDLNGKYMLAHVASAEGIVAAETIMGDKNTINYNRVPSCIYSFPEVGVVGYTEDEAAQAGYDVDTSTFPLSANGKALAHGDKTGFVKIVFDKTYGEVLGVHIVAAHATDMIAEATASLELEATVHDLAKTVHPHPTLSEVVMEAAHGAVSKPIHSMKK